MISDALKREVTHLTQELVRIPSHKDVPDREREVALFIESYARNELGLETELITVEGNRPNVMVRLPGSGGGKKLLFNGHTDTVPPYRMTIDPFGAEIRDGFIWGRGANDMKGAIAAMLVAMGDLKRRNLRLRGDVVFSGVIGEEERSEGTEYLVKSGFTADGAIVGEPSGDAYAIGHRGLEWLAIDIEGVAAHGGMPHLGVNAISKAAALITEIEHSLLPKLADRVHPTMGRSVMNLGKITGGTQPSSVADHCRIEIDRRYIPGESVETVLSEYQEILDRLSERDPAFKAAISRMPNNMLTLDHVYLDTAADAPIVTCLVGAMERVLGRAPTLTTDRGWTDAALLSHFAKIPTVVAGPGRIKYSHTEDERIPIADLYDMVAVYRDVAESFCR